MHGSDPVVLQVLSPHPTASRGGQDDSRGADAEALGKATRSFDRPSVLRDAPIGEARTLTIHEAQVAPHVLSAEAVAALLEVRLEVGLSSAQVLERLARYGANRLQEAPPRSPWRVLLGQFRSILIMILIGAALLAALVGSFKDALVILAVVVINALVGFYQEYRAERSLDALKSM